MSEANEQASDAINWVEQGAAAEGLVHALLAVQAELRTANLLRLARLSRIGIIRETNYEEQNAVLEEIRAELDLDDAETP